MSDGIEQFPEVAGLIVAAGNSARMGSPKALLRLGESTFLEIIANALLEGGVGSLYATLPEDEGAALSCQRRLASMTAPTCETSPNLYPKREMLGSVQTLLSRPTFASKALLICPVDMPFLTSNVVQEFLATHKHSHGRPLLVAASHRGERTHPLLISHHFFPEVHSLGEADSLRTILERHAQCIIEIENDDPGVLFNINTPEDYARATNPSLNIFDAAATEAPGVKSL